MPDQLEDGLCAKCLPLEKDRHSNAAAARQREENERLAARNAEQVMITTEPGVGLVIEERLGIVSAECVFGMNLITDFFSSFTDTFGGRSQSQQRAFRNARTVALQELKLEAAILGANAVVATKLDYSEISGGGKSMLFLVASGTAVRLA